MQWSDLVHIYIYICIHINIDIYISMYIYIYKKLSSFEMFNLHSWLRNQTEIPWKYMSKTCPWIVQVQIWDEFGKLVHNISRCSSSVFWAAIPCKPPLSVQQRPKSASPGCPWPHLSCSKLDSVVCSSTLHLNTSICLPHQVWDISLAGGRQPM